MTFSPYMLVSGLALLAATSASATSYWPLEMGNQWVYKHTWPVDIFIQGDGSRIYVDRGAEIPESAFSDLVDTEWEERSGEFTLEVTSSESIGGRSYFRMSNQQLLREDGRGNVVEYQRFADQAILLFDFSSTKVTHQFSYSPFLPNLEVFTGPASSGTLPITRGVASYLRCLFQSC